MKRVLKWAGLSLLAVIVLAVSALYGLTELRFRRNYETPGHSLVLRSDPETLARGRHVATVRGCVECHGPDLGGRTFLDVPILAQLYASNLTAGEGGIGGTYTGVDWERAIRQGVGPDGKPLLFMPGRGARSTQRSSRKGDRNDGRDHNCARQG